MTDSQPTQCILIKYKSASLCYESNNPLPHMIQLNRWVTPINLSVTHNNNSSIKFQKNYFRQVFYDITIFSNMSFVQPLLKCSQNSYNNFSGKQKQIKYDMMIIVINMKKDEHNTKQYKLSMKKKKKINKNNSSTSPPQV